jgi:hypothetical protein
MMLCPWQCRKPACCGKLSGVGDYLWRMDEARK